jgi:hypothetical protein
LVTNKGPDYRPEAKTEMATLNLHRDTFHPEWNYTIEPRPLT